jgi:hypothetical protein
VWDVGDYKPKTFALKGATAIRETRAILYRWGGNDIDHWIAFSQIDEISQVKHAGDSGELVVSEWFAGVAKLLPASRVHTDG